MIVERSNSLSGKAFFIATNLIPLFVPRVPGAKKRLCLVSLTAPMYRQLSPLGLCVFWGQNGGMMQTFTYTCETCGRITEKYHRLKEPHRCKICSRKSGNANLKKHSGDSYLKKKLIKERGSFCERCGVECKVMMHHKIEIKDGGETTPENCILLCQDCHKAEHGGRGVGSPEYWYDKRYPSDSESLGSHKHNSNSPTSR